MDIFFVSNEKPRSYNDNGKKKKIYKDTLKREFQRRYQSLYSGLPISDETLQAHITYIHQIGAQGQQPDADNLSKPLIDAFCGVIYCDDRQVIRRTADILALKDFDFVTVDASSMPYEVYSDFQTFFSRKEKNIIFFAVSSFLPSQIKVGVI